MADNFQLYAKYYNLLYRDKDYGAEVNYVNGLIKKYNSEATSILELGSGTGIHGNMFQKRGYKVFGIERSEAMVAQAASNGLQCLQADITSFQLDEKYDVVLSLFHVISYLNSNSNLINAFQNAHHHLKNNGIFIFDVWYSPAVYEQGALPRIKKMQNDELEIIRFAQPEINENENTVDVKFTIIAKEIATQQYSELLESHPMRHFSIPEISLLATHTGFEVLHSEEFLTGNKPSAQTWGMCFIIKKVNKK